MSCMFEKIKNMKEGFQPRNLVDDSFSHSHTPLQLLLKKKTIKIKKKRKKVFENNTKLLYYVP